MRQAFIGSIAIATVLLLAGASGTAAQAAQAPAAGRTATAPAPVTARASASIDLTGNWVSYVTEDWRFRMVTPPKGDYTSVPLNKEGLRVADSWDWQKDQAAGLQCKVYGAPSIMRLPTRLRIGWQTDNVLKVETDTGSQVRLFTFGAGTGSGTVTAQRAAARPASRSWQGTSVAQWEDTAIPASGLNILTIPQPPPSYAMKVVTSGLRAGYLRANGVPYSERTTVTEYYDTLTHSNGQEWLIVTTVVDDPTYLQQPFITTTHFKREPDGSRWRPTPCEIVPPTRGPRPVPPTGYRTTQPRG